MEWFTPTITVVAGVFMGIAAASGVIAPMIPVRWGMIAAFLGSGVVGYVGFWVWLLMTLDWSK